MVLAYTRMWHDLIYVLERVLVAHINRGKKLRARRSVGKLLQTRDGERREQRKDGEEEADVRLSGR